MMMVRSIIHINEYSQEEKAATWYTTGELLRIKFDVEFTLLLMDNGHSKDISDLQCTRGLETFTTDCQTIRKKIRRQGARQAVMEEQAFQTDEGVSDPKVIADLYFVKSRPSRTLARVMGLADAKTAESQDQSLLIQKMSKGDPLVGSGTNMDTPARIGNRGIRVVSSRAA
jgi:hypothetical protein